MTQRVLVTGAAGFIGSWTAASFSEAGDDVLAIDNFSRRGNNENASWLRNTHDVEVSKVDVRDGSAVEAVVRGFEPQVVIHLAAQVAVTTSVAGPRHDFETNALGTFNMLEGIRLFAPDATFIFASTNKVYGDLFQSHGEPKVHNKRFVLAGPSALGVSEDQALDFHSPYGCSKGAADQYTLDYSRIYGLRTFALRQSCIYGPRQFGVEDQGWVAWFVIAAILKKPISIFGTGHQVRDLLHVDDLVALYQLIAQDQSIPAGAYNVGGGPTSTMSLLELVDVLNASGLDVDPTYDAVRPGDQPIFVSDISRIANAAGWNPKKAVEDGVRELTEWVDVHKGLISDVLGETV